MAEKQIFYQQQNNYININQNSLLFFDFTNPYANTGICDFYIELNNEVIYTTQISPTIIYDIKGARRKYYFDASGILQNGNTYQFYFKRVSIATYDKTNVICLNQPKFTLSLPSTTVINQSSTQLTISLNINSIDYLTSFKLQLDDTILSSYWDRTWTVTTFPIENLTLGTHVITVSGTTNYDFQLSASLTFTVDTDEIHILFAFTPENIYEEGRIKITSDVINIVGQSLNEPMEYINNEIADLSNNKVTFAEGFNIDDDFYIKVNMQNIQCNTKIPFLTIKGAMSNIEAYWWYNNYKCNSDENDENWAIFVELKVKYPIKHIDSYTQEIYDDYLTYTIISNYITHAPNDAQYFIGIKREDNYYQVYIEEAEE